MKYGVLFFLWLGFIAQTSVAQNVSGQWYGVGKVDMQGSSNSYLTELVLVQKGKSITGELNYYFRDSLFSNKITGSFDAATRTLVVNATKLIYYFFDELFDKQKSLSSFSDEQKSNLNAIRNILENKPELINMKDLSLV